MSSYFSGSLRFFTFLAISYPVVYIFCILFTSIYRLAFYRANGNSLHSGFTFFADTIFALSGMFNVILFFATRPELIVGPTFTIDEQLAQQQGDSSRVGSNKFGHLPDHQYTGLSPDLEKSSQSDFNPQMLTENNRPDASPLTMNTSLPSRGPGNSGYPSVERGAYQRSRGSSPPAEEEEDYGHLPS